MPRIACLLVALATSIASSAWSQTASPSPVIAAERAFAADVLAFGVDAAFRTWSTEDAIVIARGTPRRAHDQFKPDATLDPSAPTLVWWPSWAGMARSGDLGFTIGGVEVGGVRTGHYLTVWKRQPDGGWKWVYDGGVDAPSVGGPGPDAEPAILPTSERGSTDPDAALSEVRAIETALAVAARQDQKAAHLSLLAPEARLYIAPMPPAVGPEARAAALDGWPPTFEFSPRLGGGASDAGDLVWTYGRALWTQDSAPRGGHYVRLWQKADGGWRLVVAHLVRDPAVAPDAAPPPERP